MKTNQFQLQVALQKLTIFQPSFISWANMSKQ